MKPLGRKAEELLEELFHDMFIKLVEAANFKLRDYQAAEDIVQDTFALAQEKIEDLISCENPRGWLYNVMKNKLLHELRSRSRFLVMQKKLEVDQLTVDPPEITFRPDYFDILSEEEYEMLRSVYVDGLPIRMVAEMMSLSYDVGRKRIQKAKEKLRHVRNDQKNSSY